MAYARHAVAVALLFACTRAHADETRAKSPALVVGGAGTVAFGVASGVGAGFLTFWATTSHGCSDRGCDSPPYGLLGVAVPLQLLSLGAIGGGIAMMTIGSRRVHVGGAGGEECATTADCGELHCIEGRCRATDAPPPDASARSSSGYVTSSVVTDVCALLTTAPPWMIAYAADFSRFGTGFQLLPLVQLASGPALHLFRGRLVASLVSLLGWSGVAAATFFVPTVVSPNGDEPNGLAAGTATLIGGGAIMTIVDALMARSRSAPLEAGAQWLPSVQPMPGGVLTGLSGVW